MDIDEFEMKPLTSGLGFENRSRKLKDSVRSSALVQKEVGRRMPTMPPSEEFEGPKPRSSAEVAREIHQAVEAKPRVAVKMTNTLPRPGEAGFEPHSLPSSAPKIPSSRAPARPDPLANIKFEVPKEKINEDSSGGLRRGASDAMIRPFVPASFHIGACFLDTAFVLAISLIFLVALVTVTRIDVLSVLSSARVDLAAQISLGVLFLAVFQMYLLLSRSFFAKTLGEWTFDIQLGESHQVEKWSYPFRVLWRNVLVLVTGIFLLPILSLIFRKDLTGKLAGLRLYRKNI